MRNMLANSINFSWSRSPLKLSTNKVSFNSLSLWFSITLSHIAFVYYEEPWRRPNYVIGKDPTLQSKSTWLLATSATSAPLNCTQFTFTPSTLNVVEGEHTLNIKYYPNPASRISPTWNLQIMPPSGFNRFC